jgi:hypothetical protein
MAADLSLVKTPHEKQVYTQSQIEEFVKCADPVTGYAYFLTNFFFIQHPTKGRMRYEPFEYQKKLASTYHDNRYSISMLPRQCGKSTTAAGYMLWFAMFVSDSTVLVAAHKHSGSQEIMTRIRFAYESCPDHIRAGVTSYNKGSLDFENGSRIVSTATTENTGRGMSLSLLFLDEFAFVRPSVASDFWTSISPTLATGGKCIITSTPNSDEDQFALLWKGANKCFDEYGNPTKLGINGFKAFTCRWDEHPDRDEAWAQNMRAQLGDDRFEREINCRFIIADETLIAPAKLTLMERQDPMFKIGQVKWFSAPKKDGVYVVALDPSLGTGGDAAAIQVFEAHTTNQIAEWQHNRTPIPEQIMILAGICDYIHETTEDDNSVYYSVENNSVGEAALISIAEYGESNIRGYFLSEPGKHRKGFTTTRRTKMAACNKLKMLIEKDKMTVKSGSLISELKSFVAKGQHGYEAKPGEHDDLVSATLIIVRMLQTLQSYYPELDSHIKDHSDVIAPMPFVAMFG